MFDSGVASGDPTETSVVLWTRVTGPQRQLRWELGTRPGSPEAGTPLATGELGVSPDADGTVRVRVEGLPPGTALWYRFIDGTEVSPTAWTSTLPAEPDALTIGLACCGDYSAGPFGPYRWVAEHRPDLVLHLGDYVYERSSRRPFRSHEPRRRPRTLADFRRRYRQYHQDPDLAALHQVAPWISLWDDHEFSTTAWRAGRSGAGRRSAGVAGAARVDAAIRANLEWLPRDPDTAAGATLDRHRRIGDLVDVIVVDCRLGRDRPVNPSFEGPRPAPERDHPGLLSDQQWAWLERILEGPAPRWTIVASSVQFSPLHLVTVPTWRDGRPTTRPLINPDQWDGHPQDRERLLALLAPRAGSVLVVSGDLHGRFLTAAHQDGVTVPELTIPSVSARSFARQVQRRVPIPRGALERWLRYRNPHLTELDSVHHGAAVLRLDRDRIEVELGPDAHALRFLEGSTWRRGAAGDQPAAPPRGSQSS